MDSHGHCRLDIVFGPSSESDAKVGQVGVVAHQTITKVASYSTLELR